MLEGLTSRWITPCFSFRYSNAFTIWSTNTHTVTLFKKESKPNVTLFTKFLQLTATVIFPRIRSGMGPWILFFSFSAQVPISSMAMNTSVYTQTHMYISSFYHFSQGGTTGEFTETLILQAVTSGASVKKTHEAADCLCSKRQEKNLTAILV